MELRLNGMRTLGALAVALAGTTASVSLAADAANGKKLFEQRCQLCHTAEPGASGGGQGPPLAGILGRRAAAAQGFPYSKALGASNLRWDARTLDRYLAAPARLVPGTTMPLATPSAAERADLIAYLATLKEGRAQQAAAARANASAPGASVPSRTASAPRRGTMSAFADWRADAPGVKHHITPADLPAPFATPSVRNSSSVVDRPAGAALAVPKGFTVTAFSTQLKGPRTVRVAPNGDIFVAETRAGRVSVLRAADGADKPSETRVFASGLDQPFGIAFHPAGANPKWVYIANNNSVVRFAYENGDLQARGKPEVVVRELSKSSGGHSTRDVAFSKDGRRMFVSVGSASNVAEREVKKSPEDIKRWEAEKGLGAAWGTETHRAAVLVFDPKGQKAGRVFAAGIRNCVGLAVHPQTDDVWCATNERDGLGDDLVPDYVTRVREGAFYGWPWYYIGANEDPRHRGERRDLASKVTVPDVLIQPHSAALTLAFYPSASGVAAFPAEYHGDAFVALHGSWNRSRRTGYKLVRVPLKDGVPSGEYEDFLTGFVVDDNSVWGRPVGVAVARDGALLMSDDGGDVLWRIAYTAGR